MELAKVSMVIQTWRMGRGKRENKEHPIWRGTWNDPSMLEEDGGTRSKLEEENRKKHELLHKTQEEELKKLKKLLSQHKKQ